MPSNNAFELKTLKMAREYGKNLLLITAFAILGMGCSNDEPSPEQTTVNALFVNALHDEPIISIMQNGEELFFGLGFKESTSYLSIDLEDRKTLITIMANGVDIERELQLFGEFNSIFLGNTLGDVQIFSATDEITEEFIDTFTNSLNFSMRLVNLSLGVGTVSLRTSGVPFGPDTENGLFGQIKAYAPFPHETGLPWTIEVRNTEDELILVSRQEFEQGKTYTLFTTGFLNDSPGLDLTNLGHSDAYEQSP